MSRPARSDPPPPPTRDDLDALPVGVKGEIIEGVLYAMTRPRARHQRVAMRVASLLESPFDLGRSGPGGWWLIPEPGIELPRSPEIAPDIAGWRRERMPSLPEGTLTLVPDWVCEVLSPTTRRHDLLVKAPYYASIGVPYLWFVDLDARALLVNKLAGGFWVEHQRFGDETDAQPEPFAEIPFDMANVWQALGPAAP